ncbi:MAG: histidinol-phosphate transaminase [Chloroflexi bacterium]|nr:histidinol-phosphate transaminase [Chloroflexota bacterium]
MRQVVLDLAEYHPIEPLEVLSARIGVPVEAIVKLDANENPYGPSPAVRAALASFERYHIYPDPGHRSLRQRLAAYTGADPATIVVGNGSDELIDLLCRLVLDPGDEVVICPPTFGMYQFSAGLCDSRVVAVHRRADFALDLPATLSAITPRTKIVFLASPNNPTGNTAGRDEVLALLATGALVVVDEAYYEFAGRTLADLVPAHPGLVVLRTFSKWAGLAGLRVGYGLVDPALAVQLWKIKPPYNVNVAALVAAEAALADADHRQRTVGAILAERERLAALLAEIDWIRPYPSEANFLLCRLLRGSGRALRDALAAGGIFLRFFDQPGIQDAIRVSVGTPAQTDRLIEALRSHEPIK